MSPEAGGSLLPSKGTRSAATRSLGVSVTNDDALGSSGSQSSKFRCPRGQFHLDAEGQPVPCLSARGGRCGPRRFSSRTAVTRSRPPTPPGPLAPLSLIRTSAIGCRGRLGNAARLPLLHLHGLCFQATEHACALGGRAAGPRSARRAELRPSVTVKRDLTRRPEGARATRPPEPRRASSPDQTRRRSARCQRLQGPSHRVLQRNVISMF